MPLAGLVEDWSALQSGIRARALARHALFAVDLLEIQNGACHQEQITEPRVVGVVSGTVEIPHSRHSVILEAGQFALIPAVVGELELRAQNNTTVVVAAPG